MISNKCNIVNVDAYTPIISYFDVYMNIMSDFISLFPNTRFGLNPTTP